MDAWEELDACYRTLDLTPGAPAEQVKTAWRDLVKIWHPDRFAGEPELQNRCQEKIKQINLAYETLKRSFEADLVPVVLTASQEPALHCARCSRPLPRGERVCEACTAADGTPIPVTDRTTWRWTLSGVAMMLIIAALFHFAFDAPQHTFTYGFVLLLSCAFLRQVYHSLR